MNPLLNLPTNTVDLTIKQNDCTKALPKNKMCYTIADVAHFIM